MLGPVTVVVMSHKAEALPLNLENSHELASMSITNYIILFIAVVIFIFYWKNLIRKSTKICIFNGNCHTSGVHSAFSLRINIYNKKDFIRSNLIELIQIRMSLRGINSSVVDIKVINPLNIWFITNSNEFKLAEEIEIYGIDKNGIRIFNKRVGIDIPTKNISWGSTPPKSIKETNSYKFAIININKKET